jgi:hypothetical protein
MFALEYPEGAAANTENVSASVAASTNNSNVIEAVRYEQACDIPFERLPRP